MTDLELQVRELLDRRSRDVNPTNRPRPVLLRRARRGMLAAAAATTLAAVAAVAVTLLGLGALSNERTLAPNPATAPVRVVEPSAATRTMTIGGVTFRSPGNWVVLDTWSANTCPCGLHAGKDGHIGLGDLPVRKTGFPVAIVANYVVPLPVGLAQCPAPPPGQGAVAWITLDTLAASHPGVRGYPTSLDPSGPSRPGPCGRGVYAADTIDGLPFLAFASFGPDASPASRQAVADAWASVRSTGPASIYLASSDTPGFVLAQGSAGGEPWVITTSIFGDPLSVIGGGASGPRGVRNAILESPDPAGTFGTIRASANGVSVIVVYADPGVGRLVFRPSSGGPDVPLTAVEIPPELKASYRLSYVMVGGPGTVVPAGT
jgi:hypothetical protein